MRGPSRRIGAAIIAALSIPIIFGALAWACTPQASIAISPDVGLPRAATTVSGSGFPAGPVKIMWGSASGTQIATAQGPSFAVPVTIPETAPGVYYIVAVTGDNSGSASTAFEVSDPNPAPQSAAEQPAAAAAPAAEAPAATAPAAKAPVAAATGTKPAAKAPVPAVKAPVAAATGKKRATNPTPARAEPPTNRAAGSTDSRPEPPKSTPANSRVPTPSTASNTPAATTRPAFAGRAPAAKRGDVAPSEQTLSFGDLSRGFSSPAESVLVPSVTSAAAHDNPSATPLTAGVILLSAGLMALLGGFTVAGARRRRSTGEDE